ncbi:UNVERIFIED_CONTAM: hypothetical protein Sradi_6173100 [Sesamum radiatum]|uniref:Uncharacterized protein n=1 Tax=Sesamum radiatum TaxID=300843 RepID=A0AAW2K7X0_SESRA
MPGPMRVLKTATTRLVEQKVTYLQTARRNVVNYANLKPQMTFLMFYYGDLVPIYQLKDIPSDKSVYEEEIKTDSDGSSTESE